MIGTKFEKWCNNHIGILSIALFLLIGIAGEIELSAEEQLTIQEQQ